MTNKLWIPTLVLLVSAGLAGCGSSSEPGAGGNGTTTYNCTSLEVGPGLICDATTAPLPTLKADLGSGATQLAPGNDARLTAPVTAAQLRPKYLGSIASPTASAGMAYTFAGPPAQIGVPAANSQCKAAFTADASAHVCMSDELQTLIHMGTALGAANYQVFDVGPWFADAVLPIGASNNSSFKGNCSGWTSAVGTGTLMIRNDVGAVHAGVNTGIADRVGVQFEANAGCGTTSPLACCGSN